jgi:hypothetical protein
VSGATFAGGKHALGVCDICGFTYLLHKLRDVYEKDRNTYIKACPICWDSSHPQLRLGDFPVRDPQALRDPRPDTTQLASSRTILVSIVMTRVAAVRVGTVTVTTT